jgi:ribonuclease HI
LKKVEVFIHASCHYHSSVGDAAYGLVLTIDGEMVFTKAEGFKNITNGRADIIGLIEGLKNVPDEGDVVFYLANGYVLDTLNKGWLENWKTIGFKKKKHADLWQEVDKRLSGISNRIFFRHSREAGFNAGYKLAEQKAKSLSKKIQLQNPITTKRYK